MKKVLVTGSAGLIGGAVRDLAPQYPYSFIFLTRQDADLFNESEVCNIFNLHRPDYVIHLAAFVGGVNANLNKPVEFFRNNVITDSHVFHYAALTKVKKLIACSTACAFQNNLEIQEEKLQDGVPFEKHYAYAYAKRMTDIMLKTYRQQFNSNYGIIIPANVYGEYDNFNLSVGHFIPGLIHKFYKAQTNNAPINVWGDGTQAREFIYSKDVAKIILDLLKFEKIPERLIISNKNEFTTKEIVNKMIKIFKNESQIIYNKNLAGQKQRQCDISYLQGFFPNLTFTNIDVGLANTVKWFIENYPNVRQ